MKIVLLTSALCILTSVLAFEPVTLLAPQEAHWLGERITVRVELRARGRFSGEAHFNLPELPRTQVMKLGSPSVASESSAQGEVFVQRHTFSFFSQVDGALEVPQVAVSFSVEKNGEIQQVTGTLPAFTLELKRPPGTVPGRYVVSSPGYTLTQSWSSAEEKFTPGDVLSRTVAQSAKNVSGMALPPLPQAAGSGVRVYPPKVEVSDQTDRGLLNGQREETLRYRFEQSGEVTLPSVKYQWWNPQTEKLETRVLEGRTVTVSGPVFQGDGRKKVVVWSFSVLGLLGIIAVLIHFKSVLRRHWPRKQSLPPLNAGSVPTREMS